MFCVSYNNTILNCEYYSSKKRDTAWPRSIKWQREMPVRFHICNNSIQAQFGHAKISRLFFLSEVWNKMKKIVSVQ